MFRRLVGRLFRKERDCCFGCLFLRRSRTADEDLEEEDAFYYKEETREASQVPAYLTEDTSDLNKQPQCQQLVDDNLVALIEDLASEEFVTSKIFACRMACSYYESVTLAARDELRKILNRLSVDDNLQVRIIAVSVLLIHVEKESAVEFYNSYIISALEKYIEEEKVGVSQRDALMLIDVATYPHLSEDLREAVIPVLLKYSRHPSWEVRHMIASSILEIMKAMRAQTFKSRLAGVLQALLADAEPVVRNTADKQVEEYYNYLIELPEMCCY